jgi:uncharacterized peroxidase-related enzyme
MDGAWLAAVATDWRGAALDEADRALCAFAERLTKSPAAMTAADLAPLRAAGLDDAAIHDAAQVVSYFNYINRIADALGVDPEPWLPPLPGVPAP